MRKILIGLISFAAVVGAFLLYSRIDKTPPIDSGAGTGFTGAADSNFGRFGDANEIGKIGDIGIGPSEKVFYITRDDNYEIIREFGYETVLHKQGDVWELIKPYWNIYKPMFKCYMTADQGSVEMETAAGSTTPKDATFSGNVVIHILPGQSGDVKETTIYLDDLIFLSDRSQLATSGPVRLVSQELNLLGIGMELIYNDVLDRLELFRIFDLESLVFKVAQSALTEQAPTDLSAETEGKEITEQPVETTVTVDSQEPGQEPLQYYKCLFSRNVLVDTPDQLIFAAREVLVNDFFWSNGSGVESGPAKTTSGSDANEPVLVRVDSNEPNRPEPALAETAEPNEPSEKLVEVTVTCDSGFIIVPRDSVIEPDPSVQPVPQADVTKYDIVDKAGERATLITENIDYSVLTEDTLARGPTELTFYAKDSNSTDPNQRVIPVKVTAQKQAKFIKASNQAVFEGDCFCTMPQRGLTSEKNVTFSAPQLTINLPDSNSEQTSILPDMTAPGPAELVFYIEDSNVAKADRTVVPVKITAQKQVRFLSTMDQVVFEGDCICQMGSEELDKAQNFKLTSPMLTVNLPGEKTGQSFAITDFVAAGPVELDFYIDDITGAQGPNEPLPAKVFALKQARFLSSSKQVFFEGPCRTIIIQEDPNFIEEFTLLSEWMTVDLPKDANDSPSTSLTGIRHLTAEGGIVTLTAIKKAKADTVQAQGLESQTMVSGIEIKCSRIDYDSEREVFLASGPAMVVLSNSKVPDPNEKEGGIVPGKQWWAVVSDCNNLRYLPKENRIIADAEPDSTLIIDYITIEDGNDGPVVMASAGHVDIVLMETPDSKTSLSTLTASRGIDYTTDRGDNFIGSELFFDHEKSLITITGDDIQPCYYNGALVDGIEYNLKTGAVKAQGVGIGALELKKQ